MTAASHPITLDADGRKRLRASIAHWKRLATGKRREGEGLSSDHCALCARWSDADCATSPTDKCPVYQATGRSFCHRSPYNDVVIAGLVHGPDSPEFRAAAEAELAFLCDLLARAKETEPVDLAPCPGCGLTDRAHTLKSSGVVWVDCDCGWSAPHARTEAEARAEWNRRAPALRWRSEPPDVPGWWWTRYATGPPDRHPTIVHCMPGWLAKLDHDAVKLYEWAGPIPESEEPAP